MQQQFRGGTSIVIWIALWSAALAGAQKPVSPDEPVAVPRISFEEFRKVHASGAVLVVDVRDEMAYAIGHIPGAIGVPLAELDRRIDEVRSKAGVRTVVTYCACPSEQTAAAASVALHKRGVKNVSVLVGGYLDWVARGGEIERNVGRN